MDHRLEQIIDGTAGHHAAPDAGMLDTATRVGVVPASSRTPATVDGARR